MHASRPQEDDDADMRAKKMWIKLMRGLAAALGQLDGDGGLRGRHVTTGGFWPDELPAPQ